MKMFKKNNSGFTLVELIIAMAILAIIMTAVASLMGSSVASHRKQKAEIKVHTSAQETYNQISDSIMQAREVVIAGYEVASEYDFSELGSDAGVTPSLIYYVKDDEMKAYIISHPNVYGTTGASTSNVKLFSEIDSNKTLYVKKLAIMTSVPLDIAAVPVREVRIDARPVSVTLHDNLDDSLVKIDIKSTASGTDAFTQCDNLVHIYTFDGENMYYEKQYSYMISLNDMINPLATSSSASRVYNDGLSYVKTSNGTNITNISACSVSVDDKNGSIGIDIDFNSKNMTYTTKGMINIRNSYVLKGKDN